MTVNRIMPLFETERLTARLLTTADTAALQEIVGDPEVMKFSVGGVCDENATLKFIEWCHECYRLKGVGPSALVEKSSQKLIGFCGIDPEDVEGEEELCLGYRLAREYWGKGLATEAVKAALAYGYVQKNIESIGVIIEPEHHVSIAVVKKAGFKHFRRAHFQERLVNIYHMTAKQWSTTNHVGS